MKDYSVKAIREEFKSKGIFYTPPELALYLKSLVDVEKYKSVYDPTCGRGNLLKVFDDEIKKYGQDITESEIEVARDELKNFTGVVGDTLKEPAFMDMRFDVIVANPPFSIKWEETNDERFESLPCLPPASKADYAFIAHCLHLLSGEGVAVIMEFPGILYRKNREGKIRQWLVENNYIDKVIHIPGNKFTDTAIATCVLVIRKNKISTDIEFIDTEIEKNRIVSFEEVKANDFNLSVNTYVEKEIEVETIDPIALESQIRDSFKNHVRAEVWRVQFIKAMDGIEYKDYLDEILEIIKEARGEA